jgi:hypothetical protein
VSQLEIFLEQCSLTLLAAFRELLTEGLLLLETASVLCHVDLSNMVSYFISERLTTSKREVRILNY